MGVCIVRDLNIIFFELIVISCSIVVVFNWCVAGLSKGSSTAKWVYYGKAFPILVVVCPIIQYFGTNLLVTREKPAKLDRCQHEQVAGYPLILRKVKENMTQTRLNMNIEHAAIKSHSC